MPRNRTLIRSGAALALAAPLLLGACGDDESAGPDAGVTVEDLEELEGRIGVLEDRIGGLEDDGDFAADDEAEDDELIGQTVTVSGEVTQTVDVNGFVLSGDEEDDDLGTLGDQIGEGILVVGPDLPTVDEGDVVQVVGTVTQFTILDVEEELGFDLDDELYVDFEQQVALLPVSIDTTVPAEDE